MSYHDRGDSLTTFGFILLVIGVVMCLVWACVRSVNAIGFHRNCECYLKRAADANTIEIAKTQLEKALMYAEHNDLTSGYTSILYYTPDEDIGFWYNNLKASLEELEKVNVNATQLEKSNLLIKLRETILDEGKSTSVTFPGGISIHPYNTLWALVGLIGLLFCTFGFIAILLE